MGVLLGDVAALLQEALVEGRGVEAERHELVTSDVQVVLCRFLAGVRQVGDLNAGQLRDELREFTDSVGLGDLVEDLDLLAACRWVAEGDLNAADRVFDVDERTGLSTGPVHRQRVTNGGLHEESVEHRAVVTVVVEAVDEPLIEGGLRGLSAPHDSLVEVGDAEAVVLGVEGEEQLIERLGHVVHRARVGRVQDLAVDLTIRGRDLDGQVALGDRGRARPAVAIDTHGAEVHDLDVEAGLDDGAQEVVGTRHVVVDGVALGLGTAHRVRRRTLLGEVDDGVRAGIEEHLHEAVVLFGEVEVDEGNFLTAQFLPHGDALTNGTDWRE